MVVGMPNAWSLGDPDFFSSSSLRAYCENGRKLIRPLGPELRMASADLRAALREVPLQEGNAWLRSKIVAAHLKHAAISLEEASASFVRCYMSFQKNFIYLPPGTNTRPRRKFVFDE